MVTFGPFWALFLYALGDIAAGCMAAKRYVGGKAAGDDWKWQWSRALIASCSFLAAWDCLRIFAGGFWEGTPEEAASPPWFAYSIYPLNIVHLVLVPLQMMPNTEFLLEARRLKARQDGQPIKGESCADRILRMVVAAVAIILAILGFWNFFTRVRATLQDGFVQGEEFGGITKYTLQDLDHAKELGYPLVMPEARELDGVFGYAIYSLVIGVAIQCSTGWYGYTIFQFVGLVGQALSGAILQARWNAFSYGSNVFEVVAFSSMVWADIQFWHSGAKELDDEALVGQTELS